MAIAVEVCADTQGIIAGTTIESNSTQLQCPRPPFPRMNGKGDKRRPGDGYASGWDRIFRRKKMVVGCAHCGYENHPETARLKEVGAEGAWVCPACSICNTSYHKPEGYVTVLGYQRTLDLGYGD